MLHCRHMLSKSSIVLSTAQEFRMCNSHMLVYMSCCVLCEVATLNQQMCKGSWAELTSQNVHSIAFASPATEGNSGSCFGPVVYALKAWVTSDDLVIVITTMLSALQSTVPHIEGA